MERPLKFVVLESGPLEFLPKIFIELKKEHKVHTILISLTGDLDNKFLKKAYNDRISLGLKYFKIKPSNIPKISFYIFIKSLDMVTLFFKIKKIKPDIVIGRSNPSWTLLLFKKFFFNKVPFIYFPYDIRSSSYIDMEDIKKAGVPNFEIRAERFLFLKSQGIIHKGHPDELNNLNEKILGKNISIKYPQLYFFPYCLSDFMVKINKDKLSKKDGEIHLVFAGNMGTSESWVRIINKILSERIHFHLYSKTANLSTNEEYARIGKVFSNIYSNPYFHLHSPVDQDALAKELSKYDFGIFSLDVNNRSEKISTGNKFSSYLEAGIPIFNLSNFETNAQLINKYNIGINVDPNNIENLRKKLSFTKNHINERDILQAREELQIKTHLPRFKSFICNVLKKDHSFF